MKKSGCLIFFIIAFGLCYWISATHDPDDPGFYQDGEFNPDDPYTQLQHQRLREEFKSYKPKEGGPDPNREVLRFDWDKMDYVYKDEVPVDNRPVHEPPPMPDYYVAPVPQQKSRSSQPMNYEKEMQVMRGGKRYRVNVLPDGTLQLIPIR